MSLRRGDTIIEVILAVTIFSFVAMSALTLMNNGLSMAQRALEITLVRQQVDSQAEMLRYLSQSQDSAHRAIWNNIRGRVISGSPVSVLDRSTCPAATDINNVFALAPSAGPGGVTMLSGFRQEPQTYAKVSAGSPPESQGISVQLVRVSGGNAYDAYIQACWNGPGTSRPMTIGTIVRIYEPGA